MNSVMTEKENTISSASGGGFMNPRGVLEAIGIKSGMIVGDFGSGPGYFAIPLGYMVGNSGKVYAVDILDSALEALRSRAALEGVHNIETIRANLEISGGTKIPGEFLDLVIVSNILFQTKNKNGVLLEARRTLKKGGHLAIIDWEPDSAASPNGNFILSKEEGRKVAEEADFVFEKNFGAGEHHWGLLFKK
jgi:ubiquinone/menaquinone biosynthesis C-methylase UbiE